MRKLLALVLVLPLCGQVATSVATDEDRAANYILSAFNGNTVTLQLMYSADATNFWFANPPTNCGYYGGAYSIVYAAEQHKYWMAFTPNDYTVGIGYSSDDLKTCSAPTYIDMRTKVSGTALAWAPDWTVDPHDADPNTRYHLITVLNPSADYNACCFTIYEMHPTASDWTNTANWSATTAIPVAGFPAYENPIDATIVSVNGSGRQCQASDSPCTFYMFYKWQGNSFVHKESIGYATGGTHLMDPYTVTKIASADSYGFGDYHEAPALIDLGDRWRLYMDFYENSFTLGQLYYADSFDLFATFSSPKVLNTPSQAKHGTVIRHP